MNAIKNSKRLTWIIGVTALLGMAFFISIVTTAPQCPNDYTQAQIDASGCIIGASIGAGIFFTFLPVLVLLLPIIAVIVFVARHRQKH